ncbi:MAG: type II secretion system F family protein [Pirellulales bacterium]|nr:type II secretion system F family protein [Pirellulales bacterium]
MFGQPRIALGELGALCRRVGLALETGLDIRRVLAREASGRASRPLARRLDQIAIDLGRGRTLADSLADTGKFFPPLVHEMISVGEETGQVPEVLRRLAEHYESQLRLRRSFLAAIAWPLTQLVAAIAIVGFLIWILGIIATSTGGKPLDVLGLGLSGNRGAAIYFLTVAAICVGGWLTIRALLRSRFWAGPFERLLWAIPVLGASLRTLALSRLAWSLQLTLDTGMPLKRALPLSLRSTHSRTFAEQSERVVSDVQRGREISEALADTRVFPADFLDALEVGEGSGRLPETMRLLSTQYEEHARRALTTLTMLAGFAVWAGVALLIAAVVIRLFMYYVGTINGLLDEI